MDSANADNFKGYPNFNINYLIFNTESLRLNLRLSAHSKHAHQYSLFALSFIHHKLVRMY
jgi:hypothetical protein